MRQAPSFSFTESNHPSAESGFCPEIDEPEIPQDLADGCEQYSEFSPEPAIEYLKNTVRRSMQGGSLLEEPNPADEFYKTWFGTASYGAGGGAGPDAMSSAGDGAGNSITINYDAAGNMLNLTVLSTSDGSKVFTYEWDEFDRLKYAKRTGTSVSDYEALYNYSLSTLFLRKKCLPPGRFSAKIALYGSVRIGKIEKKLVDQATNYETTLYVNDAVIRKFLALSVFSTKKSLPPSERFSAKIVREERLIRKSASLTEYELVRYIFDGSRLLRLDWNNTGSDNTFTRRWMHPDHLGTASLISSDAGDAESITLYLPYGAVLEEKSETGFRDPYGFTGKELEVDLGIMYFGARWYNPQLGRWLSPDPLYLVTTAKNAEKEQNIYHYAGNNPWKFVDPDGFKKKKTIEKNMSSVHGITKNSNIVIATEYDNQFKAISKHLKGLGFTNINRLGYDTVKIKNKDGKVTGIKYVKVSWKKRPSKIYSQLQSADGLIFMGHHDIETIIGKLYYGQSKDNNGYDFNKKTRFNKIKVIVSDTCYVHADVTVTVGYKKNGDEITKIKQGYKIIKKSMPNLKISLMMETKGPGYKSAEDRGRRTSYGTDLVKSVFNTNFFGKYSNWSQGVNKIIKAISRVHNIKN